MVDHPSMTSVCDDRDKRIKCEIRISYPAFNLSEYETGKTPNEILDFLRSPGGHSLLIKGRAGTGKTTLALQIIEELADEQVDYYLSTRVSDESLYRQFPWLKEKAKRNEILKAGKIFLTKARPPEPKSADKEQDSMLKAAQELISAFTGKNGEYSVIRTELQKLEGQIESGELGDIEGDDFSLDYDGGSVTLDFGIMLPELELAYDLAESHLPKRSLMVIDSIEALSEKYGITAQRIMSTLQKDLVENSGTNIIYVMEAWENTDLDYLGDGVVVMNSEERNGRRVREVIIEKVRGSKIDQWKYMFTLMNGRMHIFDPVWPGMPEQFNPHYPVNDPNPSRVSSGNENIDSVFGGFPRGAISLIEVGPDVPQEAVRRIELSLVADFLSKMRGVVWFPLTSMNYNLLNQQIEQLINPDCVNKCLKILHHDSYTDTGYPFINVIEGSDASHDLKWNSLKYLLSGSTAPHLSLLGYDALESIYAPDVMASTAGHLDAMRRLGNVIVAEATSSSNSLKALANQSTVHIKIESLSGTVMICGEKPHTKYHYLEFHNDRLRPRLLPMV